MSEKSVVILSSVAAKNVDALVKSGYHEGSAVENGNVVVIDEKMDGAGYNDVYKVTTPVTDDLDSANFYMVYEAPVPVVADKYKGITDDPREFEVPKETVFNMVRPQVGDEIVMTKDSFTGERGENDTHVIPANGELKLEFADSAGSSALAFEVDGETFVSIGNDRVTAYKLRCVEA